MADFHNSEIDESRIGSTNREPATSLILRNLTAATSFAD